MQSVSATYTALMAAGAAKEVRAIVAGTVYTQAKIMSAYTYSSVMELAATAGNCVAKELTLVLRDPGEIPRMAQIQMQYRLNDGTTHSEWIPKGTYFIYTREEGNGVVSIDAFDPMLKADQDYMQSGNQGGWPKVDTAVVAAAAARLGVAVDSRTAEIMNKAYSVPYPGYGDGAYTIREVLGYIASMYAANWIITDENKLRLLRLWELPPEGTSLLVTQNGEYILIGGYRIRVG